MGTTCRIGSWSSAKGFGGLQAARTWPARAVDLTLVDRRNFHLFQPLTYQVATGSLSAGEVCYPLRAIFKRRRNVRVLMAEVEDFDLGAREVRLDPLAGDPGSISPLRHADRRRRIALLVLRQRRMAAGGTGGQVAGERARGAGTAAERLRAGWSPTRRCRREWLTLRRRRRRADRGRDGGADRRARPRHPAARLSGHRSARGPCAADRGGGPGPDRLSAIALA